MARGAPLPPRARIAANVLTTVAFIQVSHNTHQTHTHTLSLSSAGRPWYYNTLEICAYSLSFLPSNRSCLTIISGYMVNA